MAILGGVPYNFHHLYIIPPYPLPRFRHTRLTQTEPRPHSQAQPQPYFFHQTWPLVSLSLSLFLCVLTNPINGFSSILCDSSSQPLFSPPNLTISFSNLYLPNLHQQRSLQQLPRPPSPLLLSPLDLQRSQFICLHSLHS